MSALAPLKSSAGQFYPDIEGYHINRPIGGGGFSRVFRAVALNKGETRHPVVAIKVVHYVKPQPNSTRVQHPPDRKALQKEVQIHAVLKHVNVLEFIAVQEIGVGKDGETEAARKNHVPGLYMVLELAVGGDLFDKISPDIGLEEDLAHFYFTQLMAALEYIHGQGITHRDVKPENLLLDADGNLKLADFGLCGVYKYKGKERMMNGACGSLPYIAPEMNGEPYRGEPVDVWSSGAVLFAMCVGNTPWDEPTARSPEYNAYLTKELFKYEPWPRLSPDVLSLVRKMLEPDPKRRISLANIKEHRWYKRSNELLVESRDPVTLAERLLHGLLLAEGIAETLHSDGARASVPEEVSLTQPQWNSKTGEVSEWHASRPSSSAVPALNAPVLKRAPAAGTQQAKRTRHEMLTQKMEERKLGLPAATAQHQALGAPASQFTQTLNHLTQWSMLAVGKSRFSPHLTRFFCNVDATQTTTLIVRRLHELNIDPAVFGLRTIEEGESGSARMGAATMDEDGDTDMGGNAAAGKLSRSASGNVQLPSGAVGGRGSRIKIATVDRRKCLLQGEIRIEALQPHDAAARIAPAEETLEPPKASVFMSRSRGNPMEWRFLYLRIIKDAAISKVIYED